MRSTCAPLGGRWHMGSPFFTCPLSGLHFHLRKARQLNGALSSSVLPLFPQAIARATPSEHLKGMWSDSVPDALLHLRGSIGSLKAPSLRCGQRRNPKGAGRGKYGAPTFGSTAIAAKYCPRATRSKSPSKEYEASRLGCGRIGVK